MSLSDAVGSGSERRALEALRDALADQLDGCESARDYAALSLRLMDCLSRISALESAEPVERKSVLDDLAKRRADRSARATG